MMKTQCPPRNYILLLLLFIFGCQQQSNSNSGSSSWIPIAPTPTETRFYLANDHDEIIAEEVKTIFDGRLYKFINGPYFILSGRLDYDNAFSTQMPMQNDSGKFGMNCKFTSTDCSGPCLIDANHGRPIPDSLLIANEQEHLFGKADRVYHYTSEEIKTDVVMTLSRLELYGYGPYCQSINSILDNYYSLDNISSTMPDLHNNGFHVISK